MIATTYTVMLISDYNSPDHMERIQNDESAWSPDLAEHKLRRAEARASGAATAVLVERRQVSADDVRFSIVNV